MGGEADFRRKLRAQAMAVRARRIRMGKWSGGVQALTEYQGRIFDFAEDILGIPKHTLIWSLNPGYKDRASVELDHGVYLPADWDGTPDPIAELGHSVQRGDDTAVESGTGTGKSFFMAVAILWFIACYKDARVFTLAPKEDQLKDFIWKEIDDLWPAFEKQFPDAEKNELRIRMVKGKKGWGAQARTVGVGADEWSATKARGMHAEHMMIVCEEATGIHAAVWTAVKQTCTAPHNFIVAIGNPDHQFDGLHQFAIRSNTRHIIASSLDHPNVVLGDASIVPGAVSRSFLEDVAEENPPGSRLWESHVRGISPTESSEALIPLRWAQDASQRFGDKGLRNGYPALGVDVANSENGDKAAIAEGIGGCLLSVDAYACPDANKFARDRVWPRMKVSDPPIRARNVGIDGDGVGAGCVNEMKRLGERVVAIHHSARAYKRTDPQREWEENEDGEVEYKRSVVQEELFLNLRAQMWWQMRKDLQRGTIALPDDPELHRDLATPEYEMRNGVIRVEPKEEIKKRLPGGRSPDKGEAAVYWNWVRSRRPRITPPEPVRDPDDDPFFEEHWERLREAHNPHLSRRGRIKRKPNALTRKSDHA